MDPKRTSTSAAPAMNHAAIRQLINDPVAAALEAQASNMANIDNTNRNPEPRETPAARKCTYKEFMSSQPFYCTEGAVVKKMEDEFYNLVVKGNELKIYARRFQELAVLCPNMVPNTEKLMKVFIRGLPKSIEGNVTSSKPQTLEEAINITQRLMDQVTKHNYVQGTNDHKRKFDDSRITTTTTTLIIATTTTTKITVTITTVTMITTNSRIEGKKLSGLMRPPRLRTKGILETKGTMETFLYVQDAPCITPDFALLSVRLATKSVI
nr:reverse transcriptase domain-containing protein [Tanacetum cinerariifolium]